jgi:hypothetical protein
MLRAVASRPGFDCAPPGSTSSIHSSERRSGGRWSGEPNKAEAAGFQASLYQTIDRLQRHGLVEVSQTTRVEGYPDQVVYAITDAGREVARQWLREMLRGTGGEYPEFIAASRGSVVLDLLTSRIEPGDIDIHLDLETKQSYRPIGSWDSGNFVSLSKTTNAAPPSPREDRLGWTGEWGVISGWVARRRRGRSPVHGPRGDERSIHARDG